AARPPTRGGVDDCGPNAAIDVGDGARQQAAGGGPLTRPRADARPTRLCRGNQGSLPGGAPGPEDDVGALGNERPGLFSTPSRVGIGGAFRRGLVGAQDAHARSGIAGAVLDAQTVRLISRAGRSIDPGDTT